jgi:hypothetical protein
MNRRSERDGPTRGAQRIAEFLLGAVTENWGTKILAFLLALAVFVATRDEVTRSFTIPLRVIEDPDRVLLTEPPATVEVRLRGPWVNVNRLAAAELGPATLDLREVKPGPMALDPASIVMPPAVVLDALDYAPVDLRFEALVERQLAIEAVFVGEVDGDHELTAVRIEPEVWALRGRVSTLDSIAGLRTEPLELGGRRDELDKRVALERPSEDVEFAAVAEGERPTVRVVAKITPIAGELELVIATAAALRDALPGVDADELPATERVTLRGPRAALRELEALDDPLRPIVEIERPPASGASPAVSLRFEWSDAVPEPTRAALSISPPRVRLRL